MEVVRSAIPLPIERIVPLFGYKADWYPFRQYDNTISDPKTTAAVGAMIGALARGGLPYFRFRSDDLKARSTARFFGIIDAKGGIKDEDIYFRDLMLDDKDFQLPSDIGIEMYNKMWLGFRQLPLERWPATRLYSLDFATPEDARNLAASLPIKVFFRRVTSSAGGKNIFAKALLSGEAFVIDRVESAEGGGRMARPDQIKLTLMTLENERGYWLDTGAIR